MYCCRLAHLNIDYSITLGLAIALTIKYIFFDPDLQTGSKKVRLNSTTSEMGKSSETKANGEAVHETVSSAAACFDTTGESYYLCDYSTQKTLSINVI